jgi:hypothetical protein
LSFRTLITLRWMVAWDHEFTAFTTLRKVAFWNFYLFTARIHIYQIVMREIDLAYLTDCRSDNSCLLGLSALGCLAK